MIRTHLLKATHFTGRLVFSVLIITMLMVGLLPAAPVQAAQSDILDTFTDATGFAPYILGANVSEAQSFHTTTANFVLTGISLNLYKADLPSTTGSFAVDIYTVDGITHQPGALVKADIWTGNLTDLTFAGDGTDLESSPVLHVVLQPDTDYYVVLRIITHTEGNVYWGYALDASCPVSMCMGFPSYYTENGGSGWLPAAQGTPMRMIVSADNMCTTTGVTSDWNVSTTWDCAAVPDSTQAVIINHPVTLSTDVAINAELQLNADVTTGANTVFMDTSGTINATSTSDIVGTVRRLTPASGTPLQFNNAYTTIQFTNSLLSRMEVTLTKGAVANWGTGRSIPRTYTLTPSIGTGETFDAAIVQLAYQPTDVPPLATESKLVLWRYTGTGTNWTNMGRTGNVDTTTAPTTFHFVSLTGVTAFSPWTISDVTPTAVTLNNLSAASAVPGQAIVVVALAALLAVALGGLRLRARRTVSQHQA